MNLTRFSRPALLAAPLALFLAPEALRGSDDEFEAELPAYLQCVPYAREVSGIRIFGDAHTWWDQAEGRYARGKAPRVGAVMAFAPTERMPLGHVAAVSRIVDSRTVLLDHANWSPINGRRGQIERGARAIDVSPANDWSEVRVWYHPIQALGTTAWPVRGFIYGEGALQRVPERRPVAPPPPVRVAVAPDPSRKFANAFAGLDRAPARAQPRSVRVAHPPAPRPASKPAGRQASPRDPLDAVLALYD